MSGLTPILTKSLFPKFEECLNYTFNMKNKLKLICDQDFAKRRLMTILSESDIHCIV